MGASRDGRELGEPLDAHRLDEAALTRYLTANVADFSGPCKIQQFRGGQSNPTFLIEAGSGAYVLRKKPPGELLPSAHAVDREYRVIKALADSDVPVPVAHCLCEDESVLGQMFYVMDYVPGRIIDNHDLPSCSPGERRAMFESMISVFGALHAVDYEAVGLGTFGKPTAYIERQVTRWSGQYEASAVEACDSMDALIQWLPENNPDDDRASIVHGDYRPGNLIFANDSPDVVAVLDWELSTIGHPFADLGYFCMPYYLAAEEFPGGTRGRDLQELGIPEMNVLLERYAASAGLSGLPNINYYVAFAMFRLAAILAGVLRRGLDGNAADPRAVERGRAYRGLADIAWHIATRH
jgi:aminoglycoside phosphotransferase (APT) family kinase protein